MNLIHYQLKKLNLLLTFLCKDNLRLIEKLEGHYKECIFSLAIY